MCGISGGWTERPDPERLARSLEALVRRGPDSSGTFLPGPGYLGARRLAILDLPGGEQPAFNAERSVAAVLNGEIYNFEELRPGARGDTAILPSLWEEHGAGMFSRLRGMFALAILDTRAGCLVLARDRLGKKPLFFRREGDALHFSSELRGLRPLLAGAPPLSRQAIFDYLRLGFVPGSILEGVEALAPGEWARFDGRALTRGRYWTLPDFEGTVEPAAVRSAIAEAVRLRLRSDVPAGVFLSGGIDSTIVAYEAAKHGQILSFTASFPGTALDESEVAARTAAALGIRHEILPVTLAPAEAVEETAKAFDQPLADPSAVPSLALAKAARRRVKVALVGDGGDELFAGYRRHLAARLLDASPGWLTAALSGTRLRGARRRTPLGFAARFLSGLGLPFPARYLRWATGLPEDLGPFARGASIGPPPIPESGRTELERFLNADLRLFLPGDLLPKMDQATMWSSLEARSPFLDADVVSLARRIPPARLLTRFRTKAWLRALYADALPAEVRRGSKKGFEPPLEAWMAGELRPLWNDLLRPATAKVWTHVDPALLSWLEGPEAAGRLDVPKSLYALLMLELWLRLL